MLFGASLLAGFAGCHGVVNQPVDAKLLSHNLLFTAFQETPKYLDSVASYVLGGRSEPTSAVVRAVRRARERTTS